jgi:putative ABC transport system substrate-binding protein
VEGKNIVLEQRWAEGKRDRLAALADELVRLKVDVIATEATGPALAAKKATSIRSPLSWRARATLWGLVL